MDFALISRKEALAKNLTRYFTGKECKFGHVAQRATKTKNCIECEKVRLKKYRDDPKNLEKLKAAARKNYMQNREKVLERGRARNASGYNKEYYYKNKEAFLISVKKWIKENPERRNVYRQNRRAIGGLKFKDIRNIKENQKYKCAMCFVKLPTKGYHIDHIQPISKGGTNELSNIQITCETCNKRKGSKDPFDYAKSLGRLL